MVSLRRERVIAVSIRRDIDNGFMFPAPVPLEVQFKDILEDDVDDKYYLSEAHVKAYMKRNETNKINRIGFKFEPVERLSQNQSLRSLSGDTVTTAKTLTLKSDRNEGNLFVNCKQVGILTDKKFENFQSSARVYDFSGLCPTLTCGGGGIMR